MKKCFKIYRNLHKGNFSVQGYVIDKKGYRLVDRVSAAVLTNVTFKVSESGRKKVLRERRKNVHAFVVAEDYDVKILQKFDLSKLRELYYNPYKHESFVYKDTGESLSGKVLNKVLIINNKVYQL
jgi:hypothetical protein